MEEKKNTSGDGRGLEGESIRRKILREDSLGKDRSERIDKSGKCIPIDKIWHIFS